MAYQQQHFNIFVLSHQCTLSKAPRKHGLSVLPLDYRKAVCYIIFKGQFRCWLDLSILISAQKCFRDNSCPVLGINAYLFPTGKS